VVIKHVKLIFVYYFVAHMKESFVDANKSHANKSFVPKEYMIVFEYSSIALYSTGGMFIRSFNLYVPSRLNFCKAI